MAKKVTKKQKTRRQVVRWAEEEWEEFGRRCFLDAIEYPLSMKCDTFKRVMEGWPEKRRRTFQPGIMDRAEEFIQDAGRSVLEDAKALPVSKQRSAEVIEKLSKRVRELGAELESQPTQDELREKVLGELRPCDIMNKFPVNVLLESVDTPMLLGAAMARLATSWEESQRLMRYASQKTTAKLYGNGNRNGNGKHLPKVVLVGFSDQETNLLRVYFKGRATILCILPEQEFGPPDVDIIVSWSRLTPHPKMAEWVREMRNSPDVAVIETGRGLNDIKADLNNYLPPPVAV